MENKTIYEKHLLPKKLVIPEIVQQLSGIYSLKLDPRAFAGMTSVFENDAPSFSKTYFSPTLGLLLRRIDFSRQALLHTQHIKLIHHIRKHLLHLLRK